MSEISNEWQVQYEHIKSRDIHLLNTGLWSDITFIVGYESEHIKAHKLILSKTSPIFASMFYDTQAEKIDDVITVPDVEANSFKQMLRYIYTNDAEIDTFALACTLKHAATKYILPHLVKKCDEYMDMNINAQNACNVYEIAKRNDISDFMGKAMNYIRKNTKKIFSTNNRNDADLHTIVDVFGQDELDIDSEMDLVDIASTYSSTDQASEQLLYDAIKKIRFLTLTPKQISDISENGKILTSSDALAILKKMSSSDLPMPDGFSTSINIRNIGQLRATALYCRRDIGDATDWKISTGWYYCQVSFKVNKNITVLGIQIPTQRGSDNQTYTENVHASLWSTQSNRSTQLVSCTDKSIVQYNTLHNVYFDIPYNIEKDTEYFFFVLLHKTGYYRLPYTASTSVQVGDVYFEFELDNNNDCRTGCIQSVIFK